MEAKAQPDPEKFRELEKACKSDWEKACGPRPATPDREHGKCMFEHKDSYSEECKKKMEEMRPSGPPPSDFEGNGHRERPKRGASRAQ
jgi:hypothetical protein